MKTVTMAMITLLVSLGHAPAGSLAAGGPQAPSPCAAAERRQLDFWVGEWDLTWPDGGKGTNVIRRDMDGCVITERFESATLKGMSVSTYDPATKRWLQTWVDSNGSYMTFAGGLEGGRMALSRDATIAGKPVIQRMIWSNVSADSLDWSWERSDDGGKTWKVVWPIRYTRRPGTK
jgi:hypothetical protein